MHHRAFCSIMIPALLIACSRDNQPVEPVPHVPEVTLAYPDKAVLHWSELQSWDDDLIAQAAEANLVLIPLDRCYSPESYPKLDALRELNPDIAIVGYHGLLAVATLWPDTAYLRAQIPYDLDYWNAVRDDWAYTTTGDTFMIWNDVIFLNPIKNGGLNLDLIDDIVGLVERYQDESGHPVDGVLHDYFMYDPYMNPAMEDRVDGEADFDGDGVGYYDDEDEQALFMLWQKEYARAFRSRFGDDFIQIANGRPPQEDAELAGILNGLLYERFPLAVWRSDRDGFVRFLANQEAGYLSTARGRTWSVVMDEWGDTSGGNMFCLVTSMLTGCFYAELYGSCLFNGWTLAVAPGFPKGEMTLEGAIDSALTVRRTFSNGEARIRFSASGWEQEAVFDETLAPTP